MVPMWRDNYLWRANVLQFLWRGDFLIVTVQRFEKIIGAAVNTFPPVPLGRTRGKYSVLYDYPSTTYFFIWIALP